MCFCAVEIRPGILLLYNKILLYEAMSENIKELIVADMERFRQLLQ